MQALREFATTELPRTQPDYTSFEAFGGSTDSAATRAAARVIAAAAA
jgi:hypothetical protein